VQIVNVVFVLVSIWLSLYSANALVISVLFLLRRRSKGEPTSAEPPVGMDWPEVTVQLPVYNEPHVIRRLIDSIAQLDYPREKLIIQVLDDSSDETISIATEAVDYWSARGVRIHHFRREDRSEYKAGNLRFGMTKSSSEFIAIFDADFIAPPDWLKRTLMPFFGPGGDRVGMVQTRWLHHNETQSALTKAQALLLDMDFGVDKLVRSDHGMIFRFNGAGGIWRRRCIEEVGGWSGDVLSEDADLSYRAQLAGWTFRYLKDVTVSAELPTTMSAFTTQQSRWASGSMQVFRKLFGRILRSRLSPWKKLQAFITMTNFFIYPLIILMVLLALPIAWVNNYELIRIPMLGVGIASLGAPLLIILSEWNLAPGTSWWKRIAWLPFFIMLWTGIAVSLTQAVLIGLLNFRSSFNRTPKTGMEHSGQPHVRLPHYSVRINFATLLELALGFYAMLVVAVNVHFQNGMGALIQVVYALGFSWVAMGTIWEAISHGLQKLRRRAAAPVRSK
jgi:cellulose synthase/poly-beta-1,6-N-acetylglucosamine synthase-like glycosyltransferase